MLASRLRALEFQVRWLVGLQLKDIRLYSKHSRRKAWLDCT